MTDWVLAGLIALGAANFYLTLTLRAEIHRKWSRNKDKY